MNADARPDSPATSSPSDAAAATGAPLYELDRLNVAFPAHAGGWTDTVRGVSLSLAPGERLGIVGESGSGKSLTGRAMLGLLPQEARWGARAMRFEGDDLLARRPRERRRYCGRAMSMILQDAKYALNPVMTVAQQMREAFLIGAPRSGRRELDARVLDALAQVHIREPHRVAASYPHQLSGGMGQRVMIAMMMSTGARLIVADEPTSALDTLVAHQVLRLLDSAIAARGAGLIFISHDLPLVMAFCDTVLVMYAGRVVERCRASELASARHPYTRALLAARPSLEQPPGVLPVMERDPSWRDGDGDGDGDGETDAADDALPPPGIDPGASAAVGGGIDAGFAAGKRPWR